MPGILNSSLQSKFTFCGDSGMCIFKMIQDSRVLMNFASFTHPAKVAVSVSKFCF